MKCSFFNLFCLFIVILAFTEGSINSETSLIDPNAKGSYLLNSILPSIPGRDVVVLAVDLDGTMYLVEPVSGKVIWSLSSGRPTYSSYQASRDTSQHKNDYFVDIGEDWNLYLNSNRFGKVKLAESAEEYLRGMPHTSKEGVTVGTKKTKVALVDAKSGNLLNTFGIDDSSSSLVVQSAEETSLVLMEHADELIDFAAVDTEKVKERLYIKRIDYEVQHYSHSGKVLWNVTFSEFKVEFLCQEFESYFGRNDPNAENASNFDLPFSYPILVHRIRGNSLSEFLSKFDRLRNTHPGDGVLHLPASNHNPPLGAVESVSLFDMTTQTHPGGGMLPSPCSNYYPLWRPFESPALGDSSINDQSGGKALYLPASNNPSLDVVHEFPLAPFNSKSGPVLALPSPETENSVHRIAGKMFIAWILIPLFAALVSIVSYFFNNSLALASYLKLNKHVDEFKGQAVTPKKKKTRKSGNNKNYSNNEKRPKNLSLENKFGDTNEHPNIERNERNSLLNFIDLVDARIDGRKIGRLQVSNKEIAKGSNGTIVLEGIYDGRPAAVKRLVRTHYDVALKEIQNLIASDQHPNIVRWYGVEYDQDFVYLSLERCACSLNDFICMYSESSQIPLMTENQDSIFSKESNMQLHTLVENGKDIELWKANGYPSPQLLKLMRDMVNGLSHLHELGIIHRDLKPQNVLISKERSLCAKLSDMGISKRLTGDISSFTLHATGSCGSSGWQAPEQLLQGRQTRAVDLFSLGCVLFFCLTGGKHPYGESIERDVNIVNDNKDLFVVESIPEAWDLFSHLLDPNPEMRPRASDVLHHPLFWSSETRLSFLRDVSDRVELEDRENESELLNALESIAAVALNGKWDEKMETAFLNNIGRYRRYKFDSVRDLLRVIRNKSNHYRELPQEIQGILGQVPEGFDNYFSCRFPKLLIEVYKVIYRYCEEEEFFRKYITLNLI